MTRPWRSVGLIASFALPMFMAASMNPFLTAASNSITRQVLDDNPTGLDVAVVATGRLGAREVADLDDRMRGQLDRVGRLGVAERTMHAELTLQLPPTADGEPAQTIIGSGGRFVARDGALEALEVVEGDRSVDGVWISERLAGRLELVAGSLVVVSDGEPVLATLSAAGVFANLWEGERDSYWDHVSAAGSCVFLATHDPRTLDRCGRVLHIRDGALTDGAR